jgi:NAD(P)-dependent dehydrogenase (short-subunit alcohol dehydrogenase family)
MGRLAGKIALITGAGNGLGRAMAKMFAEEGAFVYVTDRDEDSAAATVAAINEGGAQAAGHRLDVTDATEIAAVFDAVKATHSKLDILVNNAGNLLRADFRHTDDAMWESVLNPHVWGAVRVTRAALPLLQASGKAAIVNLSSIMAVQHARQLSAYSTAKAAVAGLSRSLAVELAPYGIRCNYMCPGFIPTAMTGRYTENPLMAKALLAQMPMRRFGTPEEVARVALFLASDDSAYTTGEGIMVDGGMSLNLA